MRVQHQVIAQTTEEQLSLEREERAKEVKRERRRWRRKIERVQKGE
jgi:hypothetical protein